MSVTVRSFRVAIDDAGNTIRFATTTAEAIHRALIGYHQAGAVKMTIKAEPLPNTERSMSDEEYAKRVRSSGTQPTHPDFWEDIDAGT